ncbi:MAG: hypothetical protein K2N94_13450 [Lachnospiraceae bacterium]|nr:hypothetical protein [Lachnospiraceae bacterium]
MNEQKYEQEINLGKIFYRIFRDWRKIFVIAMVIAVGVGAGNFAMKRVKIADPEYLETAEKNYERELAAFQATGETLQREIENLEETRAERETYNANSVLMKINPFREFNASLQLYVATDYQIMPELMYQNIDLSNRILRSYITYMVNGDMYQYIMSHLSTPIELRYLKEVLSISADYDNRMVTLSVRNVDAQACEEILTYALEGIMTKQPEIEEAIGEHTLNSVNQAVYEAVNLDLDDWQKGNIQYISNLSIWLQEKAEALADWRTTPEPRKEYTLFAIIKSSIKKMILGFLVGGVLAAVFIAFRYIMSDKLQDARELKNRFGLRVIAQLPKVHGSRVWVGFDRLFARMGGLAICESDAAQLTQVAAQSVSAELAAQGADLQFMAQGAGADAAVRNGAVKSSGGKSPNAEKQGLRLAFTGNVASEEIEKLLAGMKWENGCFAQSVPSILRDPAAAPAVMAADYVVLVEKQEESTCSQIERELEELQAWKKKVLGVIVIGVDAVP